MSATTRERIVRFGPDQSLMGILTTPREARADAPHIVFVNAGIVHRVGPNRLYVDMARALAALGFPVLRFDLSGLGDSRMVPTAASLAESAAVVRYARRGSDFLSIERAPGSRVFIVSGLCSGREL